MVDADDFKNGIVGQVVKDWLKNKMPEEEVYMRISACAAAGPCDLAMFIEKNPD